MRKAKPTLRKLLKMRRIIFRIISFIVILGGSDLDGAEISAETVTVGDSSFAGPLTGVSLRLPVCHILEPEIRDAIPEDVYKKTLEFGQ